MGTILRQIQICLVVAVSMPCRRKPAVGNRRRWIVLSVCVGGGGGRARFKLSGFRVL